MTINFQQEWKGLSAEEQNAILVASDSYTSYLLTQDIPLAEIQSLSSEKMHDLTRQYLIGEVTLEGLHEMNHPGFWQQMDTMFEIPFCQITQHELSTSELDNIIADIANMPFLQDTYEHASNAALPNLKASALSLTV